MTDTLQVQSALHAALRVHLELHQAIGEQRGVAQGERVSGSSEAQVPINLDAMDQRDLLGDQLIGWASMIEEETGEQCTRLNAQTAGRWMIERAEWIAGAEWAPEMIEELHTTTKRSEAMLGQLPKRTPITIPCQCGQRQWIIHETTMVIKCAAGHESTLADHGALPQGQPLTVTQAARLLDMSRSTIQSMISRGLVDAIRRDDGVPLIPRHEITKFRERLAI